MAPTTKDVVSTGKVIWIEANGATSSPVRFVIDSEILYILAEAKNENLPPIDEGDRVEVIGHPLARQSMAGRGTALARVLTPSDVPKATVLDLIGTQYNAALSPDENFDALNDDLEVISLTLV